MQQLWQDLYEGGADIVLGGHWHNYERLAPADASGDADPAFGIRQFVVGTGGAGLTGFGTIRATSEVRNSSTLRRAQVHAARLELRLAVRPDRRPDVHRLREPPPCTAHPGRHARRRSRRFPSRTPRARSRSPSSGSTTGPGGRCCPRPPCRRPGTWIWRLNPDDTWSNVLQISNNTNVQADAKSVGGVTHILLHGPSPELVSVQYNAAGNTYEPWSSRPAATPVSLPNSEIATIDLDSDRSHVARDRERREPQRLLQRLALHLVHGPDHAGEQHQRRRHRGRHGSAERHDRRAVVEPDHPAIRLQGACRRPAGNDLVGRRGPGRRRPLCPSASAWPTTI